MVKLDIDKWWWAEGAFQDQKGPEQRCNKSSHSRFEGEVQQGRREGLPLYLECLSATVGCTELQAWIDYQLFLSIIAFLIKSS